MATKEADHNFANEIWFRPEDKALLQKKEVHTTVRLGNRQNGKCEGKGCYLPGTFVELRIYIPEQKRFDKWQTEIVIIDNELKPISQLNDKELVSSLPSQNKKGKLMHKLNEFYRRKIFDSEYVSVINFEYRDNIRTVEDLIRCKILRFATLPQANPRNIEFKKYTIPLIEHDYPAKTAIMWNSVYKEFGFEEGNIMLVGDPSQSKFILDVLRQDKKYFGGGAGVGFKDEAIKYLDEIDPTAKLIGSINFVLKTPEGKLKGYNTDGLGYALSLEEKFKAKGEDLKGKKAVILGAGGTGNAIAFALAAKGMKIVILNRTVVKAETLCHGINECYELVDEHKVRFGSEDQIGKEVKDADVIINVSTKGASGNMEKYCSLAPANLPDTAENIRANLNEAEKVLQTISKQAIISDIVLTAKPTPLLKSAQQAGFDTLNGILMVVNQGVEAFWLLHGQELAKKKISKEQVAAVMKKAAGL
ncbi:MAG: hypothetical protein WC460_03545 [Patescibacteria group bacterium]